MEDEMVEILSSLSTFFCQYKVAPFALHGLTGTWGLEASAWRILENFNESIHLQNRVCAQKTSRRPKYRLPATFSVGSCLAAT